MKLPSANAFEFESFDHHLKPAINFYVASHFFAIINYITSRTCIMIKFITAPPVYSDGGSHLQCKYCTIYIVIK